MSGEKRQSDWKKEKCSKRACLRLQENTGGTRQIYVIFCSWFLSRKSSLKIFTPSALTPAANLSSGSPTPPLLKKTTITKKKKRQDEPGHFFIPAKRENRPFQNTAIHIVQFFHGLWRAAPFIRCSIFLGPSRFWSTKAEWNVCTYFSNTLPHFFFFFKGSCWAIDFLWLAHIVLIIAHFLPGISWKQLSDKFFFRRCYLATAHFLPHQQQRARSAPHPFETISPLQKKSTEAADLRPSPPRKAKQSSPGALLSNRKHLVPWDLFYLIQKRSFLK